MGMHRRVEKVNRFWQRVVMAVVFATLVWMGAAQETLQPPQPPAPTHQDAPAPEPHPELKPLVEDIRTLLRDGKLQDALPKADELLQQAKARGDKIGEAYALRFRAFALQEMRQDHTRPVARSRFGVGVGVGVVARNRRRGVASGGVAGSGVLCVACVARTGAGVAGGGAASWRRAKRSVRWRCDSFAYNAGVDWYGVGQLAVAEQLAAGVGDF
jgi:hypothetical protein